MRKLLALASILFCFLSVAVTTKAEVAEFHYFPLAQGIYTPGTKFYDGDKIVILPGQIEKVKTGATYNSLSRRKNDYKEVGKGTVTGVNFWESNAKLNLNKDVDFIDDKCVVRVPVEKNRCFNTWWENGVKWEKEGVVFDAFCAFYRATVYKPGDQEVQNAYLRTGYKHYLAEANAVYKRYDYKTAYDKFVFALGFRWPGGDVSEAEQKLEKCELYIVREEEFEELRKDAKGAQKNGDHKTVIETYHRIRPAFRIAVP
ncbi:MAG: hypothetical protein U5N86_07500 [Planctomycetota bacterium]|nr:hypothetical protein [Planctomycetota bacterium]